MNYANEVKIQHTRESHMQVSATETVSCKEEKYIKSKAWARIF